jgi:hypothetical protein
MQFVKSGKFRRALNVGIRGQLKRTNSRHPSPFLVRPLQRRLLQCIVVRTLWSFLSQCTANSTPTPFAPVHRSAKLRSKRHRNVKVNSTRTGEMGRLLNKVINFRPRFKKISRLFRLVSTHPPPPDRHSARDPRNSSCCALFFAVPAEWSKMSGRREGVQRR